MRACLIVLQCLHCCWDGWRCQADSRIAVSGGCVTVSARGWRTQGVRMNCAEGTQRAASRQFILTPFSRLPAETVTHPCPGWPEYPAFPCISELHWVNRWVCSTVLDNLARAEVLHCNMGIRAGTAFRLSRRLVALGVVAALAMTASGAAWALHLHECEAGHDHTHCLVCLHASHATWTTDEPDCSVEVISQPPPELLPTDASSKLLTRFRHSPADPRAPPASWFSHI
jgi:hypothetical protein